MNMSKTKPVPKKVDCSNLRYIRQEKNHNELKKSIKNNTYITSKELNRKAYLRLKTATKLNDKEFRDKCLSDETFMIGVIMYISVNASRQGTKDEHMLFEVCNEISEPLGINIENLTPFAYRPTKDLEIISKEVMKERKIDKSKCLKSFDGKMMGKLRGWIFAKICIGCGGHQDNVFEETRNICDWVNKYNNKNNAVYEDTGDNNVVIMNEMFIIMLDTDNNSEFLKLKTQYNNIPNLLIVNHVEFQQYIIDNYWEEEST